MCVAFRRVWTCRLWTVTLPPWPTATRCVRRGGTWLCVQICRRHPAADRALASAKHWLQKCQSNFLLCPASLAHRARRPVLTTFGRSALTGKHCAASCATLPATCANQLANRQRLLYLFYATAATPPHTTVPAFCCDPFALPRRLPAARATKAESDLDFRALLLSLVKDLLAVAHQPAWPAAPFLLLRFAAMLQVSVGDGGGCAGLIEDLSLPFSNARLSRFAHSLAGRQGPAPRRPARAAVLPGSAGQPGCTGEQVDGSSQKSGWTGR